MTQYNIKELVSGSVHFLEYRKGNLWYTTAPVGFKFPVPIEDIGDATFLASDKGILFMRYIRKHLNNINDSTN